MDVQAILEQVIDLIGTASPQVAFILFALCAIGEFGFSIPFLLETVWILCGYQVSRGLLSPYSLIFLISGTIAGREAGSIILYHLSRYGSMPLIRFYHRRFEKKMADKEAVPEKIARGLAHLSPFTVAIGRLMWLRIPLTLTLGAQRRLGTLTVAVLLAALAWDGAYIILGATVGTTVMARPVNMVLYSIAGLSLLYGVTFAVRHIRKLVAAKRRENQT
jgi:membrane-associated protein